MKIYPLTPEQNRLWIEWKMNPKSRAYNTAFQFEMQGKLDLDRFKKAVAQVRGYLESYRKYFIERKDIPYQVILSKTDARHEAQKRNARVQFPQIPDFKYLDLTRHARDGQDLRTMALGIHEENIRQPFDLLRDYPLEFYHLIRFGPEQYLFSQVSHHILSDGRSGAVSLQLLSHCYNRPWMTRAAMGLNALLRRTKDVGDYLEYLDAAYPEKKKFKTGCTGNPS